MKKLMMTMAMTMILGTAVAAELTGDALEREGWVYNLDLVEFGLLAAPYLSEEIQADPAVTALVERQLSGFRPEARSIVARKITQLEGLGIYIKFRRMLEHLPILQIEEELALSEQGLRRIEASRGVEAMSRNDENELRLSIPVFARMHAVQQAAALFHEFFFLLTSSMLREWEDDSTNVRALNAFIFSPALATFDLPAAEEFLARFYYGKAHRDSELEDLLGVKFQLGKLRKNITTTLKARKS
ncbi:MAG: hypothetical protein A2284_17830 [Deltaproteobacteria bacterium RIFOXYA12_FULL_61_11]|nr:MAG: hypothetical protein A2284_17830 [Deltaproteobacteria bacterium RIFOXYA12_FULL_61_11]